MDGDETLSPDRSATPTMPVDGLASPRDRLTVPTVPGRVELRDQVHRDLEEITGVGAWTWDRRTGLSSWSEQMFTVLGLEPSTDELTTDSYLAMVPEPDRQRLARTVTEGVRGDGYQTDHLLVRPDGAVREIHSRGRGQSDAAGELVYALGTVQDVTEARQASRDLARARDLFAGVLDATEQAIVGVDTAGSVTVFNRGARRMLGYAVAEMIGPSDAPAFHDPTEIAARAAELGMSPPAVGTLRGILPVVLGSASRGVPEMRRWTWIDRDGRRLQVATTTTATRDSDGVVTGFIIVGTDVTARLAAERALAASESLFEKVFDNAPTGIMLLDTADPARTRTVRVNPALCRITGYPVETLLAMPLRQLVHPDHRDPWRRQDAEPDDDRPGTSEAESRWVRADGRDIWVSVNVSPLSAAPGAFLVAMVEDVTSRREAEDRLNHLALHDALTGLPNRSLLLDRLEHALAAARRLQARVAVLWLDLDGFKAVNDADGHPAGDEVLRTVARRLTGHLRPGDTVARLGGDEFVVLAPGLADGEAARAVAERVRAVLAEPYQYGRWVHHLSASIGVAVSDGSSGAESLLRDADDAMYAAKEAGKNRVAAHGAVDPAAAARTARAARFLQIEHELARALRDDELVLFAQPVLDLPTGGVLAVETLLRWRHPHRGLLPPAEFLDVAETSELMVPLGRWVLRDSCRLGAGLSGEPSVFVNISGRQLGAGSIRDDVLEALAASGLAAGRLVLELTETCAPLIAGSLLAQLEELRGLGVRLAVDDVGTGYSSLTRLTELPVDILKIDRGFIARMIANPAAHAVVEAILSIGNALGLTVVAEGVERSDQEELLRGLGCRTVQGFRWSRPLSEDLLTAAFRAGAVFPPVELPPG